MDNLTPSCIISWFYYWWKHEFKSAYLTGKLDHLQLYHVHITNGFMLELTHTNNAILILIQPTCLFSVIVRHIILM